MSNPPKSPSFTYNAQRPQIPTTISRHFSRMTSNGAGPYLTADGALGDGCWEAKAQKLDADAKEGSNNEARLNEEDEHSTREYYDRLRNLQP